MQAEHWAIVGFFVGVVGMAIFVGSITPMPSYERCESICSPYQVSICDPHFVECEGNYEIKRVLKQ